MDRLKRIKTGFLIPFIIWLRQNAAQSLFISRREQDGDDEDEIPSSFNYVHAKPLGGVDEMFIKKISRRDTEQRHLSTDTAVASWGWWAWHVPRGPLRNETVSSRPRLFLSLSNLDCSFFFFLISSFCFTRSLSRLFFRSKDFLNFSISRWQSFSFAAYVQDALYTARRMPARTTGWPATALKRWIYVYIYIRVDGKTNWTDYIKVEKGRGRQSSKKLGGLRGDEEGCWTLTAIWWRQVIRLLLLFTPPVFLP